MIKPFSIQCTLALALSIILFAACKDTPDESAAPPPSSPPPGSPANSATDASQTPQLSYQVLNVYPYDTTSYTEGLLMQDGGLYESTDHTNGIPYIRSLFGIVDRNLTNLSSYVVL